MASLKIGSLSGVLNLEKPGGMTSRDVVDLVARPLRKVKVGHAGTLDPLASGVLVVCVGAATRLIEYVQGMPKTYRTVVRLGARSDTLDADGRIEVEADPRIPTEAEVLEALAAQVGTIEQVPPQFSALKVGGRRSYDLARAGQVVELLARPVRVDRIELISYAWPRLEFTVDCGSGTYIRSIARDVGEALGTGGLIEVLVRTRIGPFLLADALDPTGRPIEAILARLRPSSEALGEMPRLRISAEQVRAVGMGKGLPAGEVEGAGATSGEVALIGPDGSLVAVAESSPDGMVRPRRVLAAVTTG
jgi:tRNA pseudouridine55 synthase